ncbi:hypothetical protein POPTR_002G245800v4 [Populus trichocarpa]|uniref:Uncharacterized protein n=3 Tax=Populus trichocarpa TaxID=3694 RepID=A0ACC0TG89_POPTR|nr:dolichol-phosphate mannose synthase subunit 3 isoform X1 [Populus trichocarpa]KAI9400443.1 hypothetical protein POPTR_002G245800v4 [Populus trichocarpa]RQO87426.1 hypothetical protein POPTR_002G245800v4 [Populus trichocarpa]|eukprot:XP_024450344.1 dolichol-phosphate mannose synthase subunit 3 isoform X2 [Populus trichocarpa]
MVHKIGSHAQIFISFFSLALFPSSPLPVTELASLQSPQEFLINIHTMKHIVKIMVLLVAISACWIGLLQTSIIPRSHTWLLPIYFVISLGCYGLLMVGVGLMNFPTCPQEALLLQQDIVEAKDFLKRRGVDVVSE